MNRFSEIFLKQCRRFKQGLTQIRDTPHAIAGGVAIGVLFGFTPLYGFKTLLAVLVAWFCRCSKLAAVLTVTFHDIFFLLGPVILRWEYKIGFLLVYTPHRWPPKLHIKHFNIADYLSWNALHVWLWPTFVGSLVIGVPIAVGSYFAALEIVNRAAAVRARKADLNRL